MKIENNWKLSSSCAKIYQYSTIRNFTCMTNMYNNKIYFLLWQIFDTWLKFQNIRIIIFLITWCSGITYNYKAENVTNRRSRRDRKQYCYSKYFSRSWVHSFREWTYSVDVTCMLTYYSFANAPHMQSRKTFIYISRSIRMRIQLE